MSDYLAVDFVLLPPKDVIEDIVRFNSQYDPTFQLNAKDCLPHITLSQGIIEKINLGQAAKRMAKISGTTKKLRVSLTPVNKAGASFAMFEVRNTNRIQKLHEKIMAAFKDMLNYDAQAAYFYDKEVREASLDWVRNFVPNAAFSNYYPHITLGTTDKISTANKITFTATRLAMCHLGNFNTCREILYETELTK